VSPANEPIRRILVTGISGNLGRRVAPLLAGYEVVSVDLKPPAGAAPGRFFPLDLSAPAGQQALARLVAAEPIEAVLHLAFVIDPARTGITDVRRMGRVNVEATARLLEAIAERNRAGTAVRLFVFPSSVSAYGSELPGQVSEEAPLEARGFPYAVHKREADELCRRMHPRLGGAAVYVFRPHIFAGRTVDNFILRAFRGRASGSGRLARLFERRGWRAPVILPASARSENVFQFVHVDDVARVLRWTLDHYVPGRLAVLNLAAPGPPVSFGECARLARTPIVRLPSRRLVELLLRFFWAIGLSGVPPASLPYFLGSYTMDTSRLRAELGPDYETLLRHTSREAFLESVEDARS
jgi:nucleoside-diphosphate-sugar epimerase